MWVGISPTNRQTDSTRTEEGELKGDFYLYLHCFPLKGAVTVVAIIWTDKNGVTEEVVLNSHEVAQTRRDHLHKRKNHRILVHLLFYKLCKHRWELLLLNRYAYWHSGEQLLEVVSSNSLTFGNEEAGFPNHSLEDTMQQLITKPAKENDFLSCQTIL